MSNTLLSEYLENVRSALHMVDLKGLTAAADFIEEAFRRENTVYVFGNGASAALASHMACDLAKGTTSAEDLGRGPNAKSARRLRIIALNDCVPLITAIANDVGYCDIFLEPLKSLLRKQDLVIGISGGGGSGNVLRALEYARAIGARAISFTGAQENAELIRRCSDVCIAAPLTGIEQIEDLHVVFHHLLVVLLRHKFRTRSEGPPSAPA
jgi:D-sedoheptulose 7-phosphate isomerase